ncbi:MAG TPA: 2Fe-2S iron-sulfur cluster binding domain-containing protein [Burkholderiales bacterium]|nr:2Fe-2S iron-sulfur cluster binding domain-containing protein [Burkholderiales bacterium]
MRVQINARNRAYEFEAEPGEKILFAGLRARIDLPYECATGTCGTCKARLVGGPIDDAWPEASGKKYLKGAGEFLMCQCAPVAEVVAEVSSFVYATDPGACPADAIEGVVSAPRRLTHDVLAFDVGLDRALDFDAGQFMAVGVPGVAGLRGYSMVNFDRQARRLEFIVKRKPGGGVSEWLFGGAAEGARVTLFGPLGKATFHPSLAKNILCIAGGSGIAGMMSILARACQERYFAQFRGDFFFGVRTMADTFYLDELSAFQREFPERLTVTVALSDEDVPAAAAQKHPALRFERGMVHEVAKRTMQGRFQEVRAYLAGPPPAVDASIRFLLLEAKLTADNIRYDKFS